jgi:hypothetical protein
MKTLRCFTVDGDGLVRHRGWRFIENVSANPSGMPITDVVLVDDCDTKKMIVWPRAQVYYFWNEE